MIEKKVIEILVNFLKEERSELLSERIIQLFRNLICFKQNKNIFMSNK